MKRLIMIGGTMGVGKTTVSHLLKKELDHSVMLDGDWCWDMHPFIVNDETKKMVMDNIVYQLQSFIHCSVIENIIFCWVLHDQSIIDEICQRLDTSQCQVYSISLLCDEDTLRQHLQKDIDLKIRDESVIERSLERMGHYHDLLTYKIDISSLSPKEIVECVLDYIQ